MKKIIDGIITFIVVFFFSNGIGIIAVPIIINDLKHAYILSIIIALFVAATIVVIDQAKYLIKSARKNIDDKSILDNNILENIVKKQQKKEKYESKTQK